MAVEPQSTTTDEALADPTRLPGRRVHSTRGDVLFPGIFDILARGRNRFVADERIKRLARQPLFSHCTRSELRRIAHLADEVEVDAGQVIVREGRLGFWFFVILDGTAVCERDGHAVADLGPGQFFGDLAILSFGPQPVTVRATSTMTLAALGRREFLGLVGEVPSFQRALFVSMARQLREQASIEWRLLAAQAPARPRKRTEQVVVPASWWRAKPPPPTRPDDLVSLFADALDGHHDDHAVPPPPRPLSWKVRGAIASGVLAALLTIAALFHPPFVVVSEGRPIDVAGDITVSGMRTYPIDGHYLLTYVRFDRPNALGALAAFITRKQVVRAGDPDPDPASSRRLALGDFATSERMGAAAAARAAGLPVVMTGPADHPSVILPFAVHFRDHGLGGPSAGLIYALALHDLLTPGDEARGRTIAATGTIDASGQVSDVAFVAKKAAAARDAGATEFVVPVNEVVEPGVARSMRVRGVTSLRSALAALGRA